jgi:hypothetical protein
LRTHVSMRACTCHESSTHAHECHQLHLRARTHTTAHVYVCNKMTTAHVYACNTRQRMCRYATRWEAFLEMARNKHPICYKDVPFPHPPDGSGTRVCLTKRMLRPWCSGLSSYVLVRGMRSRWWCALEEATRWAPIYEGLRGLKGSQRSPIYEGLRGLKGFMRVSEVSKDL